MRTYGYIRVSTKEQNPDRQYRALENCGVDRQNIYLDRISGKNFCRPEYSRLLQRLGEKDLLVIKSIDRLGRNYGEILEQWRKITKEIKADIQVLDMPLLNTVSGHGDLTGIFIADLVLQILAYVAETERAFLKERQAEGIVAAKARGVHFGRVRQKDPEEFDYYYKSWRKGEISSRRAAGLLEMSHTTFYRRCREYMGKQGGHEKNWK